jgi:hypothetical protein
MTSKALDVAKEFYTKIGEKKFSEVEKLLHENVEFKGPLAVSVGKQAYLTAVQNFGKAFKSSKIREIMGDGDKAILVIDYDMPLPIGHFPSVAYLMVHEGLIRRIELFYDAQHFVEKRKEIFETKS